MIFVGFRLFWRVTDQTYYISVITVMTQRNYQFLLDIIELRKMRLSLLLEKIYLQLLSNTRIYSIKWREIIFCECKVCHEKWIIWKNGDRKSYVWYNYLCFNCKFVFILVGVSITCKMCSVHSRKYSHHPWKVN